MEVFTRNGVSKTPNCRCRNDVNKTYYVANILTKITSMFYEQENVMMGLQRDWVYLLTKLSRMCYSLSTDNISHSLYGTFFNNAINFIDTSI